MFDLRATEVFDGEFTSIQLYFPYAQISVGKNTEKHTGNEKFNINLPLGVGRVGSAICSNTL